MYKYLYFEVRTYFGGAFVRPEKCTFVLRTDGNETAALALVVPLYCSTAVLPYPRFYFHQSQSFLLLLYVYVYVCVYVYCVLCLPCFRRLRRFT